MEENVVAELEITDISFTHSKNGALLGFSDIVFNNGAVTICGVKLLESDKGQWINLPATPSKKNPGHFFKVIKRSDEMLKVTTEAVKKIYLDTPESVVKNEGE